MDARQVITFFPPSRTSAITSLFVLREEEDGWKEVEKITLLKSHFTTIFNRIFVFIILFLSFLFIKSIQLYFSSLLLCSFLIFPLHVLGIFIPFPSTFLFSFQSLQSSLLPTSSLLSSSPRLPLSVILPPSLQLYLSLPPLPLSMLLAPSHVVLISFLFPAVSNHLFSPCYIPLSLLPPFSSPSSLLHPFFFLASLLHPPPFPTIPLQVERRDG